MIFIVFFALIIFGVIALNTLDNNNLEKIENYLKAQNCVAVHYNQGQYQGVCEDEIILIKNAFTIDISKDKKMISYAKIQTVNIKDKTIMIDTNTSNVKLEFKQKDKATLFYKKVQNKL